MRVNKKVNKVLHLDFVSMSNGKSVSTTSSTYKKETAIFSISFGYGYILIIYKTTDGFVGNIRDAQYKPVAVSATIPSFEEVKRMGEEYFDKIILPKCLQAYIHEIRHPKFSKN